MSRIAVISDIHANHAALEAVLAHADGQAATSLWCLGDVVNYGPDPFECTHLIHKQQPRHWILGNHDEALLLIAENRLNGEMTPAQRQRLEELISKRKAPHATLDLNLILMTDFPQKLATLKACPLEIGADDYFLVHGGLRHGHTTTYCYHASDAADEFGVLQKREEPLPKFYFVGQTHFPACFAGKIQKPGFRFQKVVLNEGEPLKLDDAYYQLNPGSVGQPRDGDWRASYMIFDREAGTVTLHRVPYDLAATQDKMKRLGFPETLTNRLALGR